MPLTFWQATMSVGLDALRRRANDFDPALRKAFEAGVSDSIVFELICDNATKPRLALTMSVVSDALSPGNLTCWMAFSNDPQWCNSFRQRGIPMVEARIELSSGLLSVDSAAYPERQGMAPVSLGNQHVLTLRGVDLDANAQVEPGVSTSPAYVQFVTAPDVALQSEDLAALHVTWAPPRGQVRRPSDGGAALLEVQASVWPALSEILQMQGAGAERRLRAVRIGSMESDALTYEDADSDGEPARKTLASAVRPAAPSSRYRGVTDPKIERLRCAGVFGAPVFHFEDVDVVGFRITLPATKIPDLQALVEPLNFHRKVPGMVADFTWRVATPTVMIELLHYGRMKSQSPAEPLRAEDFMSQHELLVRFLVGKVDDDGSQAREASMFVPAIFVDNAWSKAVGRESQGMPKELAEFCITDLEGDFRSLEMDGALPHQPVQPLMKVVHVRLPAGFGPDTKRALLELTYPSGLAETDEKFERVDLDAVLGDTVFGVSRWRQSDFGEREFRRSFASHAMSDGFNGFRSVQASPVDGRDLPSTWINGQITVRKFKALFPHGVATLKLFNESPRAGNPWLALCKIFGDDEISLPSGDWYRLKMSMDLSIKSSLDW